MTSSVPDPSLARKTKAGHWLLFTFATLLTLPAAFVFVAVAELIGHASFMESTMLVAAAAPSFSGVLAWIALGLLLTRPAYPHWHLACWPFVILFGITAIPGCLYWLAEENDPAFFITWIVVFAFVAAIASIALAVRNLRLARQSLGRQQEFPGLPGARA
jgi:hypothetical protein